MSLSSSLAFEWLQSKGGERKHSLTIFLIQISLVGVFQSIAGAGIARTAQTAEQEDQQNTAKDTSENDEEFLVEHGRFSRH